MIITLLSCLPTGLTISVMLILLQKGACCASCRFVSDYGPEDYNCVCQHRLIQALQRLNVGPEYVRTYPPCLLEWTANRKRATTVLHIYCFDGEHTHAHTQTLMFYRHHLQFIFPPAGVSFLCPVHSWTTGEEMAKDILQHRYVLTFDLYHHVFGR